MLVSERKEEHKFAPWWKRFLNGLIDYAIVWWLSVRLITYCLEKFAFSRDFFWIQVTFLSIGLVFFAYFFIFEYFLNLTPGKYITRTRLVYLGGEVSAWSILKRTALRLVPADAITFLGKSHPAVGWHDYFSGTNVVDRPVVITKDPAIGYGHAFSTWRIFFARTIISFSLFAFGFVIFAPLIVFYRWNYVRVLKPSDYKWQNSEIITGFDLPLPGKKRTARRALGSVRLSGLQMLLIQQLSAGEDPEKRLLSDIDLFTLHPLVMIRLAEYEKVTVASGDFIWYRYAIEQAPFTVAGFFFKPIGENNWYQVNSQGLKIDTRPILRYMWNQLTVEQSSPL